MIQELKTKLYFMKQTQVYQKGLQEGKITPFDKEFYKKLNKTYISDLPVDIHIKYLKPTIPPGKCYDRSLYMFLALENSILVRANIKTLELKYGKENAGHGWIELDNYCYDPTSLLKYEKDIYYQIYQPDNIKKITHEEYIQNENCSKLYNDITTTTIKDFLPYGKKRLDLILTIPLIIAIAKQSENKSFLYNLNKYLSEIKYNESEIIKEQDLAFDKLMKTKRKKLY